VNWDAIGAIGEVVGAAGVIITLGYLAVQIRQNTASHRAAAVQALTEASASFNDLLASDADLGRILVSGAGDLDSLQLEERPRFGFALLALLRRVENIQRQTLQGRLSRDDWAGIHASTMFLMSQAGCRDWWAENSQRFNPDFSKWLDQELKKHAA
jgi:hypothetical protein